MTNTQGLTLIKLLKDDIIRTMFLENQPASPRQEVMTAENKIAFEALQESLREKMEATKSRFNKNQCKRSLEEIPRLQSLSNQRAYFDYRYQTRSEVLQANLIPYLSEIQYNQWQQNLVAEYEFRPKPGWDTSKVYRTMNDYLIFNTSKWSRPRLAEVDNNLLDDIHTNLFDLECQYRYNLVAEDEVQWDEITSLLNQCRQIYCDLQVEAGNLGGFVASFNRQKPHLEPGLNFKDMANWVYFYAEARERLVDIEERSLQYLLCLVNQEALQTGFIQLSSDKQLSLIDLVNRFKKLCLKRERQLEDTECSQDLPSFLGENFAEFTTLNLANAIKLPEYDLSEIEKLKSVIDCLEDFAKNKCLTLRLQETDDFDTCLHLGDKPRQTCLSHKGGKLAEYLLNAFDPSLKVIKVLENGKYHGRMIMRLIELPYEHTISRQAALFLESYYCSEEVAIRPKELAPFIVQFALGKAEEMQLDLVTLERRDLKEICETAGLQATRLKSAGKLMKSRIKFVYSDSVTLSESKIKGICKITTA